MTFMDWILGKTNSANIKNSERHYSVIRYYSQFAHGIVKEVLGEDLTLDEAKDLQMKHLGLIAEEDIVIRDQNKIGLEAEVVVGPEEPEHSR